MGREGATGIEALDLFFRKIARDQGETVALPANGVAEFKGGDPNDAFSSERELLGRMPDDAQAQLGSMVEDLMASRAGEPTRLREVGLHANHLLYSMAEVVIARQLLTHAQIASRHADESAFHRGKVESARWFVRDVAPKITARRDGASAETGSLMDLPGEAF